MSTLSGIAAKGEKGKSKFQSLDINNLYKASRGESLETHQHKNTQSRRHGMQTLGKVPSARRAPANLPSLKSEYSGNDPAISLVPSGGTGWGSKPGETGPPPSSTQPATSTTPTPTVSSAAPVTVTSTVSTVTPSATPISVPPPPAPTQSHGDKSWSSITSNTAENSPMFLAHQSPYFQQEFPSLSGDASGGGSNKGDPAHLPGPSLRPQTEGSWMQGGSRPQGQMGAGAGNQQGTVPVQGPLPLPHLPQGLDVGGVRNNLGPSGVGVGPGGPMPPGGMPPHHFRLMPQFMLRHNHPSGGFPPNFHGPPRFRFPYPPDTRMMPPNRGPPNADQDEHASRPIIKEEDLKVMDEIAKDTSWATHDEIDYNQTLTFSDDDGIKEDKRNQTTNKRDFAKKMQEKDAESIDLGDKNNRDNSREMMTSSQNEREPPKGWQQPRPADFRHGGPPPAAMGNFPPQPPRGTPHQGARQGEDDEVWRERRRLQNEEIAIAVERAKQRKEEEEKRYIETRQNAARKLQMLEEKMRSKTGVEKEDISTTINVQQTPNALLPDWEKDKEKNRSRKNSEDKDEKSSKESLDHGKSQVEQRSGFTRDRERERDREARPERDNTQGFSRMFQNNLPPRFQKQAADRPPYYRQGSGSSPQPSSGAQPSFDPRWSSGSQYGGSSANVKQSRSDTSERDREENKESIRDRADMGFDNRDRERYNRPPSRDNKERSHENNWKSSGYTEEPVSKLSSDNEHNFESDNRLHEKCQENEEKDKEKKYGFYEDNVNSDKRSGDSFKNMHLIQEDPFNHRDKMMSSDGERRDNLTKLEMKERPQRPDSRDSRASRESRNSRDSIREDKLFEETGIHESSAPWSDSTYDMENREDKHRKENREERDHRRDIHVVHQQSSYYQRHIPGPITKEKLEAAEKCESGKNINLVPLVRGDKKQDTMKPLNQWESPSSGGDAWQQVPGLGECWADMTSSKTQPTPPHSPEVRDGSKAESLEKKAEHEDSNKPVTKTSFQDKEDIESSQRPMMSSDMQRGEKVGNRGGGRGMRHDRGPRGWGGGSYYRGATNNAYRGDQRGRRSQNRRPREWGHSESEASADEVSANTEAGKEDKRHEQDRKNFSRSPKQGHRRSEKDERPRDGRKQESDKDGYPGGNDNRRHDKRGMYENTRMGSFEPRGEPSRRGRGAPFRSKGSAANVGRRMDGYGPPTSKRPFTSDSNSNLRDDKKTDPNSLMQLVNKEEAYSKLSHDEKMKLNQQQLAAGIIGGARMEFKQPQNMPPRLRRKSEGERRDRKPRERGVGKSGSGSGGEVDENWETTSETSEHDDREPGDKEDDRRNDRRNFAGSGRGYPRRPPQNNRSNGSGKDRDRRRGNSFDGDSEHRMSGPPPLMNGSIRPSGGKAPNSNKDQQDFKSTDHSADKNRNRFENKEKRNNLDKIDLCNTASVVVVDDQPEGTVEQDRTVFATDNNGFQEVRSKKNTKEANRQKEEPQKGSRERERERDRERSKKSGGSQSPAQVPGVAASANKGPYDRERPRGGKLPPRFAKLRETNRLQKMAQQQTQDVNEINKINVGNVSSFPMKELTNPAPPPSVNAWDKPINAALRTTTPPAPGPTISPLEEPCNVDSNEPDNSTASSQRSSPNGDKLLSKISREPAEKAVLDGTSPPVQTIIFENTNYKSAPGDVAMKSKYNTNHMAKPQRPDKPRERKSEEESVSLGFKSPGPDMKLQDSKNDPIQMPMSFNKNEDNADMKLDFRFDSDLSQLTEDKTSKSMAMTSMQMTRSIQMVSQSSAADLQFKLASVKKVWENPASMLEHGVVGGEDSSSVTTATSFTPTFTNSVDDASAYGKPSDPSGPDDATSITPENVYNPSPQMPNSANSYNGAGVNMIKPDPTSNVCKVKPQPQATMPLSHGGPLSPPAGPFAGSTSQPGQHISYQPQAQYGGMSAIPSPPTVFTAQPEIYQTFQINNPPQVLSSQGRSGFSQFASQGLGYISQGLGQTSGYSQQSLYHVQAGPPPTAPPPPPDVFQTQLSQYRIQPPGYGTSQQLNNNPSTVLISSSANSLMSASVKPSAQPPIGAIGTKAASYQTTSQPPHSQLYIYPDPQMLSQSPYLQNSQLVQRPANMQTIPPSSASYYSATTGGAGGFFPPGNSNMQGGPSLHQTTYSMQAFNTQSAANAPAGMGSFGSTMAQQYRSTAPLPSYLKSGDHQDHLSVFSSPSPVTQINPAKPHGGGGSGGKPGGANCAPQQQPSPTQGHHQFSSFQQNVSATTQFVLQMIQQQQQQQRGNMSMRRYPAPIQRPDSVPQGGRRLPNTGRAPAYKPSQPPPNASQSAANVNYYVPQNDSTKLNSSDLDAKVDAVHNECEPLSSATNGKPADITVEKSPAEN